MGGNDASAIIGGFAGSFVLLAILVVVVAAVVRTRRRVPIKVHEVVAIACGLVGTFAVMLVALLVVYPLVQKRRHMLRMQSDGSLQTGSNNNNNNGNGDGEEEEEDEKEEEKHLRKRAGASDEKQVVVLTSESCGHCKALAPVIRELQSQGLPIHTIDAPSTYAYEWFGQNGVTGFPTVCEMQNDRVLHIFTGRRTAENIAAYVRTRSGT